MGGDVDTIRALVKGETGRGCKGAFLAAGNEEGTLVVFMLGEMLVLCVGTVEEGERSE